MAAENNKNTAGVVSEADLQYDVKLRLPFLRNITIANKLNFGFAILILMMLVTSALSIYGLQYVREHFERGLYYGLALERLSLQAENELLQARRREKDFLLRWKQTGIEKAREKYVTKNKESIAALQAITHKMKTLLPGDAKAGTQSMLDAIESLDVEIGTYQKQFDEVVELLARHGHEDTGVVGVFRDKVHAVEAAIMEIGNVRAEADLLMLRRHEKDYLLREHEKYVKLVSDAIIILKTELRGSKAAQDKLLKDKVAKIDGLLDDYWDTFSTLVQTKREIAISIEKFRDAAHRIEAEANNFRKIGQGEAASYIGEAQQGSQRSIVLVSGSLVGILLFGLLLSYLLAGHIRTPIALLDKTVQRIREGEHDAVAPVITTDEAGRLAQAFNRMNAELSQTIEELNRNAEELRKQRKLADDLLLNILPKPIANRLKKEETIAEWHGQVTVLFADMVGFTKLSAILSATELVSRLNQIFSVFDQMSERHGLEKIKTMGDCYMAVGGLPITREDHAEIVAEMALEMVPALEELNKQWGEQVQIRIGINTGPVVAGVIGKSKFVYDIWGDAVNVASRMESHGVVGRIQVSENTYQLLQAKYDFEERGVIDIKNKGEMRAYLLVGRKPGPA